MATKWPSCISRARQTFDWMWSEFCISCCYVDADVASTLDCRWIWFMKNICNCLTQLRDQSFANFTRNARIDLERPNKHNNKKCYKYKLDWCTWIHSKRYTKCMWWSTKITHSEMKRKKIQNQTKTKMIPSKFMIIWCCFFGHINQTSSSSSSYNYHRRRSMWVTYTLAYGLKSKIASKLGTTKSIKLICLKQHKKEIETETVSQNEEKNREWNRKIHLYEQIVYGIVHCTYKEWT